MKERRSHEPSWQKLAALLAFLAFILAYLPSRCSNAQNSQDNRQLQRDSSQTNRAEVRRIALVIGNGAYTNAPPLKNPPNDAREMAAALRFLGFDVSNAV